jgi:hypothetical protein
LWLSESKSFLLVTGEFCEEAKEKNRSLQREPLEQGVGKYRVVEANFGNIPAAHLLHATPQMGYFRANQKLLNRTTRSKIILYDTGRLN